MNPCPHHPTLINLPPNLTCPLCAQERRRAAYVRQRGVTLPQQAEALQRMLEARTRAARAVGELYSDIPIDPHLES